MGTFAALGPVVQVLVAQFGEPCVHVWQRDAIYNEVEGQMEATPGRTTLSCVLVAEQIAEDTTGVQVQTTEILLAHDDIDTVPRPGDRIELRNATYKITGANPVIASGDSLCYEITMVR